VFNDRNENPHNRRVDGCQLLLAERCVFYVTLLSNIPNDICAPMVTV